MNFKDLELKPTYDSIIDDIYNDFFNKMLSESTRCDRLGGVFTSRNFAACAEGMQNFIKNDGRMRLILTPSFSDDDVNAIQNGLKNENDVITKNWITELDEIKDKFEQDHTKALAWLLKNNLLDIRIAVLINPDGSFAAKKLTTSYSTSRKPLSCSMERISADLGNGSGVISPGFLRRPISAKNLSSPGGAITHNITSSALDSFMISWRTPGPKKQVVPAHNGCS